MPSRSLICLVRGVLLSAALCAGSVLADEMPPPVSPRQASAPKPNKSVNRYKAIPPGRQRYFAYNVQEYPWFTHGFAVPTYDWGYFGARTRPILSTEHRYFDGVWGFTFQPAD